MVNIMLRIGISENCEKIWRWLCRISSFFSDTIEGNIAYGVPDASFESVQTAAKKMAEAHEFITRLPDGYDTIIGERGVGLSGGQKNSGLLLREHC
ncbi:hypothetical protein GCM10020331_102900 [Ectobacillus funiculus]